MISQERVSTASQQLKMPICLASMLGEIGVTTANDAREILGVETSATHSQSVTMLTYRYGLETEARFAVLQFDEQDLFFCAVMMGVPFPECWTSDLQREQRGASSPRSP